MAHFRNYAFTTNDVMEVQRWYIALEDYSDHTEVTESAIDHLMQDNEFGELTHETGLEVLKAFFNN